MTEPFDLRVASLMQHPSGVATRDRLKQEAMEPDKGDGPTARNLKGGRSTLELRLEECATNFGDFQARRKYPRRAGVPIGDSAATNDRNVARLSPALRGHKQVLGTGGLTA